VSVIVGSRSNHVQTIDVIVEQRFHSQLIGAKGAHIKEIIEKFGGISIRFPDNGKVSDIITYDVVLSSAASSNSDSVETRRMSMPARSTSRLWSST
jgi:hypothetical protein